MIVLVDSDTFDAGGGCAQYYRSLNRTFHHAEWHLNERIFIFACLVVEYAERNLLAFLSVHSDEVTAVDKLAFSATFFAYEWNHCVAFRINALRQTCDNRHVIGKATWIVGEFSSVGSCICHQCARLSCFSFIRGYELRHKSVGLYVKRNVFSARIINQITLAGINRF